MSKLVSSRVNAVMASSDNASAGHIEEYKLGTQMSVYAQNSKWSEVDIGGYHAFLLNKFIRAAETPVPDAAEAEPAVAGAEAAAEAQPTYAPAADAEVLAETARPAELGDAASVPVPVPVLVLDNDTLADAERAALAGAP